MIDLRNFRAFDKSRATHRTCVLRHIAVCCGVHCVKTMQCTPCTMSCGNNSVRVIERNLRLFYIGSGAVRDGSELYGASRAGLIKRMD